LDKKLEGVRRVLCEGITYWGRRRVRVEDRLPYHDIGPRRQPGVIRHRGRQRQHKYEVRPLLGDLSADDVQIGFRSLVRISDGIGDHTRLPQDEINREWSCLRVPLAAAYAECGYDDDAQECPNRFHRSSMLAVDRQFAAFLPATEHAAFLAAVPRPPPRGAVQTRPEGPGG